MPQNNPYKSKVFKKIVSLAGEAIHDYAMISNHDRLLVGVSGGKDSLLLMHVLTYLQHRAPVSFELVPVCFDPGFPGFNIDGTRKYFAEQDWKLEVIEFDVGTVLKEKHFEQQPCVVCSRLRRGWLYGRADKLSCGKIALGHHLDDICVSLLMCMFRGHGIKTMPPNTAADASSKRLIRPLAYVPEALLQEAVEIFALPLSGECIYKEQLEASGDRAFFGSMLKNLEQRIPHVRQCMLRSMKDIRLEFLLDEKFLDLSFGVELE